MNQSEKPALGVGEPGGGAICLVCGGRRVRSVVRAPDFEYRCRPGEWSLVACEGCGHVFIDPIPGVGEIASLYPGWYYTVNPKSPIYMEGAVVEGKMVKDAEALHRRLGHRRIRSVVDIGGGNLTRLIKLKEVLGRGVSGEEAGVGGLGSLPGVLLVIQGTFWSLAGRARCAGENARHIVGAKQRAAQG